MQANGDHNGETNGHASSGGLSRFARYLFVRAEKLVHVAAHGAAPAHPAAPSAPATTQAKVA